MLTYLITDDEPLAHRVLQRLADDAGELRLIGNCYSAAESRELLECMRPDLWFLDIQMPGVTGLELLRSLADPPLVVLTTAYAEYALEGFDLEVIDYLLKPVDSVRFARAIGRVRRRLASQPSPRLPFRDGRERHYLFPDDIAFIHSRGHYAQLYLTDGSRLLVSESLQALSERLADYDFVRIHRSYLINRAHLRAMGSERVRIGNHELPIGRTYRGLDV